MFKDIQILFFGAILMLSCSGSFNSMFDDEVNEPVVGPPGNTHLRYVNIMPMLSDSLYSIGTTRAEGGMFETWDEDKQHWLGTRFQVFGLLTKNGVGGAADYNAAMSGDKRYGVLWNQTMGISDQQGHTVFYDSNHKPVVCKYNPDAKLYRYKFFMLGTDGLTSTLSVEDNRVVASMELDGAHDIMHSFAYHTNQCYEEAVQKMPDDETTKVFIEGGQDNLYNRLSGNRGVHPMFNIKHLLCKFDIQVKGADPTMDNTAEFQKIFIKSVSLRAVKKVNVIVADDKWERDDYETQFSNGRLISQAGTSSDYQLTVIPKTPFASPLPAGFDILKDECESIGGQIGEPVIPEGSCWVGGATPSPLCKTVLIPPLLPDSRQFVISLKYRYVIMYKDDEGKYHLGPINSSADNTIDKTSLWEDFVNTEIPVPNVDSDGNPIVYKGGQRYTIVISVYGKSIFTVDVIPPFEQEEAE